MTNDQQGLIAVPNSKISQTKIPFLAFICMQIVQLLIFILSASNGMSFFSLMVNLIFSISLFFFCQRYFGRQLVGLSWKFNFSNPTELFWSHEIEPDPFVPTKMNSNVFWVGIAGSTFFWLIASLFLIFSHVSKGWLAPFVGFLIFAINCVNLMIFFKIQRIATKLSADAVRTVLLGKSEFPDAEEFSSSSETGEDEERKKAADPVHEKNEENSNSENSQN
ncbi:hypothetical protein TRFO_42297 [Tritrichomonas foetus]|uniref:Golgi apparatus membrane protein TVP23 homolog n=1 Tax=Tritrichomonas foetus TaxID=1144522 RepID=A0A1J4KWU4_9EUKA|nr:hypothetical protein TRFO_42297 [Tritrichomonas foetus]|eukprot:OHT15761.1 hypothetical protein TRFO_42297 [Tritrichomonas foetus]